MQKLFLSKLNLQVDIWIHSQKGSVKYIFSHPCTIKRKCKIYHFQLTLNPPIHFNTYLLYSQGRGWVTVQLTSYPRIHFRFLYSYHIQRGGVVQVTSYPADSGEVRELVPMSNQLQLRRLFWIPEVVAYENFD